MIYQILIDRFNGAWTMPPHYSTKYLGGNLLGVREKLDYIKGRGATSILLSPFFQNEAYHGYHITNYEMVDPSFGSTEDLKELIRDAHQRDIRVIADFVPNHCHVRHPFFQDAISNPSSSKYRSWFYFNNNHSADCLHFCDYSDLPKFNLDNPETKDYFIHVGEELIKMGIDGLRIDHALGVPMTFLQELRKRMRELNPKVIILGEVWAYNIQRRYFKTLRFRSFWRKCFYWIFGINQETLQLDYKESLDAVLDFEFQRLLVNEVKAGKRLVGNKKLEQKLKEHFSRYPSESFQVIPFIDNHDTDRFLFHCNGDKTLLEEALELLKKTGKEYVVYYGTEQGMSNQRTIMNAEPYADLMVREPMDWSYPECDMISIS